jgi:hypothetical protein
LNELVSTRLEANLLAIVDSDLFTSEDLNSIAQIKEELADTWRKKQMFRTETEMRVSVLNDASFPTIASKYWQCVREQDGMIGSLTDLGFDYRKNEVSIKRLQKRLEAVTDPLDIEELTINLEELEYKRKGLALTAHDRVREIKLWSELKGELDTGDFDTTDVNNSQLDGLVRQLMARANTLTESSSQGEVMNVLGPLTSSILQKAEKAPDTLLQDEVAFLSNAVPDHPLLQVAD